MNSEFKPFLKLNLQHFAEPVQPQTQDVQQPATQTEPAATVQQSVVPPQGTSQTTVQQSVQPVNANIPQATQTPTFDVNEIVNNISNRLDQSLNQRLAPIEQRINQPTPEQIQAQNDKLKQEFDSDPASFIRRIQEEAKTQALNEIKSQYDPLIQQTQQLNNKLSWQDNVRSFIASNPDAQNALPQITQILQENPGLMQTANPLDVAYKIAMSNNLMGNGGNIVQGVLSNEEYKKQILQDPTLREQIIQEYQAGLNNGTQQGLPPLMGNNQSGTSIPASGGEMPRNMKEAKQAALRRLQSYGNMNMQ